MARPACTLLVLLLMTLARPGLPAARADASELANFVEKVAAAAEAKDAKQLSVLAALRRHDPWLVADELVNSDRAAAADAYAQAGEGPDFATLPAYLKKRAGRPGTPAVREAWAVVNHAEGARTREPWDEAMAALSAVKKQGDAFERTHTMWLAARALLARRFQDEAATALGYVTENARRIGWAQGLVFGLVQSGLLAVRTHRLPEAEAPWREALQVQRARSYWPGVMEMLQNLGSLRGDLGDLRGALSHFEQLRALLKQHPTSDGARQRLRMGQLHYNLGTLRQRSGRYAAALQSLEQAYELLEDHAIGRGTVLLTLAGVHKELGRLDAALAAQREARAHFEPLAVRERDRETEQAHLGVARCNAAMGLTLYAQGKSEEGRSLLGEAERVFELVDALTDLGQLHQAQGYHEGVAGRHAQAHVHHDKALELSRQLQDPFMGCNVLQNKANTLAAEGEYGPAIAMHEKSLELAEAIGSPRLVRDAWRGIARAHLAAGAHTEAFDAGSKAVATLAVMLVGLAAGQSAEAREANAVALDVMAQAAIRLGTPERICAAIEQGRAVALLESLEGRERLRDAVVSKELREAESKARLAEARARALLERAHRRRRVKQIRSRRQELERAVAETAKIVEKIQREAAHAAQLLYPKPATLKEIQGSLAPTDAYVGFLESEGTVHALVATKTKATVADLGGLQALVEAIEGFEPDAEGAQAQLDGLHAATLGKLALPAKARRLLISPTGPLFDLPFAAIARKRTVVLVPSGTAHRFLTSTSSKRRSGILGIGGVNYDDRAKLPDLPASTTEIESIATKRLLGPAASETKLRAALAGQAAWRAIHFACHGLPHVEHPMRSSLALTTSAGNDGFLTASEILELPLDTELAVLSACETGRGRAYRGEGLVGLPRAFLFAGAERVLVSLWKVDDAATLAFARAFYKAWDGKDASAAEALQKAMAAVRADPRWKAPYYWGAWVLWGRAD